MHTTIILNIEVVYGTRVCDYRLGDANLVIIQRHHETDVNMELKEEILLVSGLFWGVKVTLMSCGQKAAAQIATKSCKREGEGLTDSPNSS